MNVKTLLLAMWLGLAATPARAGGDRADGSAIMTALFAKDGDGFQPPAKNKPLQALLAKKPKLTFLEACGIGDAGEVARQLAADPKLAATWTEFGWSALHLAAFSGSADAVARILERGGDVHARARTRFKNTPLQTALLAGQLATAKLLLERGADPLVRQAKGFTPLHEAALLGRRDLVDLLLAAGAEIGSRADDGRTAVSEARRGKHEELAVYLVSRGGLDEKAIGDRAAPPKE